MRAEKTERDLAGNLKKDLAGNLKKWHGPERDLTGNLKIIEDVE